MTNITLGARDKDHCRHPLSLCMQNHPSRDPGEMMNARRVQHAKPICGCFHLTYSSSRQLGGVKADALGGNVSGQFQRGRVFCQSCRDLIHPDRLPLSGGGEKNPPTGHQLQPNRLKSKQSLSHLRNHRTGLVNNFLQSLFKDDGALPSFRQHVVPGGLKKNIPQNHHFTCQSSFHNYHFTC